MRLNFCQYSTLDKFEFHRFFLLVNYSIVEEIQAQESYFKRVKEPSEPERATEAREARRSGE